jgi:predicted MFS family arabinose efflux permease
MLSGLALTGLYAHFVPLLTDRGLDPERTADIAALFGLSVMVGRLGAGYLLDRLFAPLLASLLAVIAASGIATLLLPGSHFAPLAAICVGLMFGTELDVAGYMTARYFGQRAYGAIYGWQFGMFMAGGIASPIAYGAVHDMTGSYLYALGGSIALLLAAIPFLLSLGPYPPRDEANG